MSSQSHAVVRRMSPSDAIAQRRAQFARSQTLRGKIENNLRNFFKECAVCVTGTLSAHILTCVVAAPTATALLTSAAASLTRPTAWVETGMSALSGAGVYGGWWLWRGRYSNRSVKILNAVTTAAMLTAMSPLNASGQWVHTNAVNPVHAQIWYWQQSDADRARIADAAEGLHMTPRRYVIDYLNCGTAAAPKP